MAKPLCKSKKQRRTAEKLAASSLTHFCRKCGLRADSKKRLCKPAKLDAVD